MFSREAIHLEMHEIFKDVLGVDDSDIVPTARFEEDLGGESIDLLELSFQCEKKFGVKVNLQSAFPPDKVHADDQGILTPDSLEYVRSKFPYLDLSAFEKQPHMTRIIELLTVEAIENIVASAVLEKGSESVV